MIQLNNNLSVLPFYESTTQQDRFKSYAYGEVYPLYTPKGNVIPFQIITAHSDATILSVAVFNADGTIVDNTLSSLFIANGFAKYAFTDYDVYVCPFFSSNSLLQSEGQYYLRVGLSNSKYYFSEVFTVVQYTAGFMRIKWYDDEDLVMDNERIVYALNGGAIFKNYLYLTSEVGKPDYVFEEEGEVRDGLFFPEKMISEKTYKFTFLAPEYLLDVMRFIRMSDYIEITSFGVTYICDTFQLTPKWEAQGNLASVEVEFQTNTVAKRIGRDFTT